MIKLVRMVLIIFLIIVMSIFIILPNMYIVEIKSYLYFIDWKNVICGFIIIAISGIIVFVSGLALKKKEQTTKVLYKDVSPKPSKNEEEGKTFLHKQNIGRK